MGQNFVGIDFSNLYTIFHSDYVKKKRKSYIQFSIGGTKVFGNMFVQFELCKKFGNEKNY